MNITKKLRRLVTPVARKYAGRAVVTEGSLREGEPSIRILYLGDYGMRPYLSDTAYEKKSDVVTNEVVLYSQIDRLIRKHDPDLVVAFMPRRCHQLCENYSHFQTPEYIGQRINVSGSWDTVKTGFSKSRRTFSNQVQSKYSLDYRISESPDDFDHFYRDMYLPYVSQRFARSRLQLDSYEEMKRFFEQGLLIFVSHQNQDVAGFLCTEDGDSLVYRRAGILSGDQKYNDAKAQMALFYYSIVVARSRGLRYLDAIASRAFLNDGVYQNKRRWGAELYALGNKHSVPYYVLPKMSEKTRDFFSKNPAIVEVDGDFFGLLGWQKEGALEDRDKKHLNKSYFAMGLKGVILLQANSHGQTHYF